MDCCSVRGCGRKGDGELKPVDICWDRLRVAVGRPYSRSRCLRVSVCGVFRPAFHTPARYNDPRPHHSSAALVRPFVRLPLPLFIRLSVRLSTLPLAYFESVRGNRCTDS